MERLLFTEQSKDNKKYHLLRQVAISLMAAVSFAMCLLTTFEIEVNMSKLSFTDLQGQVAYLWNQIFNTVLMRDGLVVKELAGQTDSCGGLIVFGTVAIALVYFTILKSEKKVFLMIPIAFLIFPLVVTSCQPDIFWMAAVAAAFFIMVVEMSQRNGAKLGQIVFPLIIFCFSAQLIDTGLAECLVKKPDAVEKLEWKIEESVQNIYYGENILDNGLIKKENRNAGNQREEDIALKVKMSNPQSIYLKGYIGEMYTDGAWKELPHSVYAEEKNLFYWLKEEGFFAPGQLGEVGNLTYDAEREKVNEIEIKIDNASSRYAYVPYECITIDEDILSKYDSNIKGGNFKGLRNYVLKSGESYTDKWTDVGGTYHTVDISENIAEDDYKSEKLLQYKICESYYNQFVYEYYRYVSDEEEGLLKKYIGDRPDLSKGHMEYSKAIKNVMSYLEENTYYTENPNLEDSDKSPLESFLETGKGYDAHYATAAALMFRYYGIPARYVEGYLITPDDIEENINENQQIEIKMENNHAWVEIYIDGIGFVPLEVSTKYRGVMDEADLSKGIEMDTGLVKEEKFSGKSKSLQEVKSGQTEEAKTVDFIKFIKVLAVILLIVFLAAVVFKLLQKIWLNQRERKLFKSKDRRLAVAAVYRYMEKNNIYISETAKTIGNKACYSQKEISEQERKTIIGEMRKAKRKNENA